MNTYEQMMLWTRPETNPAPTGRLIALPRSRPDEGLATRVAIRRPGWSGPAPAAGTARERRSCRWRSKARTPIRFLLGALGARGARFARELGADVVVGAETAGVPLAASVALAEGLPFAFVPQARLPRPRARRAAGSRGGDRRSTSAAGRRRDLERCGGRALQRCPGPVRAPRVVGVFVIVDMRDIAEDGVQRGRWPAHGVGGRTLPTSLPCAAAGGVLDPAVQRLTLDAIVNRWAEDDPRWRLLSRAA